MNRRYFIKTAIGSTFVVYSSNLQSQVFSLADPAYIGTLTSPITTSVESILWQEQTTNNDYWAGSAGAYNSQKIKNISPIDLEIKQVDFWYKDMSSSTGNIYVLAKTETSGSNIGTSSIVNTVAANYEGWVNFTWNTDSPIIISGSDFWIGWVSDKSHHIRVGYDTTAPVGEYYLNNSYSLWRGSTPELDSDMVFKIYVSTASYTSYLLKSQTIDDDYWYTSAGGVIAQKVSNSSTRRVSKTRLKIYNTDSNPKTIVCRLVNTMSANPTVYGSDSLPTTVLANTTSWYDFTWNSNPTTPTSDYYIVWDESGSGNGQTYRTRVKTTVAHNNCLWLDTTEKQTYDAVYELYTTTNSSSIQKESYQYGVEDYGVYIGDNWYYWALQFTSSATYKMTTMNVWAEKKGTPTYNVVPSIRANSSGNPGSILTGGEGDSFSLTSIPPAGSPTTHSLTGFDCNLTSGSVYWLVFRCDGYSSVNNMKIWCEYRSGNYIKRCDDGVSWTNGDQNQKIGFQGIGF